MILYYATIRYKSGFKSKDEVDIELFESINFEFFVRIPACGMKRYFDSIFFYNSPIFSE